MTQRISHREFIVAVRRAATAAGVVPERRPTREDSILDVLAWGTGSIEPGMLPARLEPLFRAFEADSLAEEDFAKAVSDLLKQVRTPA